MMAARFLAIACFMNWLKNWGNLVYFLNNNIIKILEDKKLSKLEIKLNILKFIDKKIEKKNNLK
jgi:hypothetical protein